MLILLFFVVYFISLFISCYFRSYVYVHFVFRSICQIILTLEIGFDSLLIFPISLTMFPHTSSMCTPRARWSGTGCSRRYKPYILLKIICHVTYKIEKQSLYDIAVTSGSENATWLGRTWHAVYWLLQEVEAVGEGNPIHTLKRMLRL